MRIQVLSDIHTEHYTDHGLSFIQSLDSSDVDVLIVAGDLTNVDLFPEVLGALCEKYQHATVLYVPGNHEYYESSREGTRGALWDAQVIYKNLQVLINESTTINGVRFFGATLWYESHPDNYIYENRFSDFRYVRNLREWVYEENEETQIRLRDLLEQDAVDVVITHHLPSEEAVLPMYRGNAWNRFFVCPVADKLPKLPKLWVFGHTHGSVDFTRDGCRFLCNPRGYPFEKSTTFDPHLIVDIG